MVRRRQSIFRSIWFLSFFILSLLIISNDTSYRVSAAPPSMGDWHIFGIEFVEQDLIMNGSIIVHPSGALVVNGCTVFMNSAGGIPVNITVHPGAFLNLTDCHIAPLDVDDEFFITIFGDGNGWVKIDNTVLTKPGAFNSTEKFEAGLYINGSILEIDDLRCYGTLDHQGIYLENHSSSFWTSSISNLLLNNFGSPLSVKNYHNLSLVDGFSNQSQTLTVEDSTNLYFSNVSLTPAPGEWEHALVIQNCSFVELDRCQISGFGLSAVETTQVDNLSVHDCYFEGNQRGLELHYTDYVSVYNNRILGSQNSDFDADNSDYGDVVNNTLSGYQAIAIDGLHWDIINNSILGSHTGIILKGSQSKIERNAIYALETGIVIRTGGNYEVTKNSIIGFRDWGLQTGSFSGVTFTTVTDNLFQSASGTGVHLFPVVTSWELSENTFNCSVNADDESNEQWDNGVDEGNWWSDYTGADGNGDGIGDSPYVIDGDSQDNYPLMEATWPMWMNTTLNLVHEFGDSLSYTVELSESISSSHWWIEEPTLFNIDAGGTLMNTTLIPVGTYNFWVHVQDAEEHHLVIPTEIIVEDTTAPTWIEHPPTEIEFGPNYNLRYVLNATDLSGIKEWKVNDTVHFAIDNNGTLTNATRLNPGIYHVRVTVSDPYDNSLSSIITITVRDDFDPFLLLVIGGVTGVVVISVVVILFWRRQKLNL